MSLTDALQLNKTEMFSKIRDGLLPGQQTRNLIECIDDLIFAWDCKQSCVLVLNWRAAQLKQINHQTLIPSSLQDFEVDRLVASNEGTLLCLAGPRGAAVLELPRRWGKEGQFMEGKPKITCRTYCLDPLLFTNNPHLEIRQVRWHPGSTTDSHLLLLLSDNTIRMYNNGQLRHVWQVGPLPIKSKQSNTNSSFGGLGDIAVDFDVGPAVKSKNVSNANETDKPRTSLSQTQLNQTVVIQGAKTTEVEKIEWPLIVLRENGNIYVLMTGFDTDKTRLQGPITITPSKVDNYGLESCAILVIPSLPPTLVIAESNGKLHHALLLEAEVAENSFNEVDAGIDIKPSEWVIHVLETVELELGLPKTSEGVAAPNYTCPIYLKHDYINEFRYFAYHNTGLHAVCLNFIGELQRFLESEATDDMVSLSTPSSAEYLICTKIDNGNSVNAVLGFVLLQLPSSLVLLLGSGQVVSLKVIIDAKLLEAPVPLTLQTTVGNENSTNQLLGGPSFVEHIRNMLQRSLTQPIISADKSLSPSPNECYELLNQSMEVLRAHYLKRHDLVRSEFAKRINCIRLQKEQQHREIESLEREREVIREQAHKLAERFEEISDYQELLIKKCHDLMRKANSALPGNIAAEKDFSEEVALVNKATKLMAARLENAKKSINKQNYHIKKGNETAQNKTFELPEKQHRTVIEVLAQMATEIDRQIRDIKRINKIVGI